MRGLTKEAPVDHLERARVYDAQIADPRRGVEHSEPGRRPLELWDECKSVIVFAVAMSTRTESACLATKAGCQLISHKPRFWWTFWNTSRPPRPESRKPRI